MRGGLRYEVHRESTFHRDSVSFLRRWSAFCGSMPVRLCCSVSAKLLVPSGYTNVTSQVRLQHHGRWNSHLSLHMFLDIARTLWFSKESTLDNRAPSPAVCCCFPLSKWQEGWLYSDALNSPECLGIQQHGFCCLSLSITYFEYKRMEEISDKWNACCQPCKKLGSSESISTKICRYQTYWWLWLNRCIIPKAHNSLWLWYASHILMILKI